MSNPWNGKVVLEAFWRDCRNEACQDWYTYLARLAPRLKSMGFDGIWTPAPCKGSCGIGRKDGVATKFGTMDSFLRMIAVCHANGLEVYPNIVLDHCDDGNPDSARNWFVWFVKQTGADGFRFDNVKGCPPEVVEDLLYNTMGSQTEYFCVAEYIGGSIGDQDGWCDATNNRCGVFDYHFRGSLVNLVESNGFFDMGSLPDAQQNNRYKTVPFVNNHDELGPTIDPDNPRAALAYAVMAAVDGSPQVHYEDLFVNFPPQRDSVDAKAIPTRSYVENIVWCHQKLEFKAGAYKVRYQGSQQLLIIERSAKAIIAVNNDGENWHNSWIPTDFGPNIELHDYSGTRPDSISTNADGWVNIAVPPVSYSIWGPTGINGGFAPPVRSTTQEFQMDDDLGDSNPASLGYGGKLISTAYRTAGAVWPATNSMVTVTVYLDSPASVDLRVFSPDTLTGLKSTTSGNYSASGNAPLVLTFHTAREGYHLIHARLTDANAAPVKAYIKVNYTGPGDSNLF